MIMLEVKSLVKDYGNKRAVDHLNLTIADSEIHGFVGPNGAGKTTTMRILATLLNATEGSATIDGVDILRDRKKARMLVGYMPDFFGVYDHLKASEYLDFYARCYGIRRQDRERMIGQLLELVHLSDRADDYVDNLSRGMKQRLCLAHSLIHDPKLLILDEPASGMDPRARAEMKSILRTLKEMGKSVLISSHILPELSEMCDSLTILDHGKLIFSGSVTALSDRMNGRNPLEIRLQEDSDTKNVETLVTILRENPLVEEITQEEPRLLRVRMGGKEEDLSALLQLLIMRGIPVCDFHRASMNLEKDFMEVTQDA